MDTSDYFYCTSHLPCPSNWVRIRLSFSPVLWWTKVTCAGGAASGPTIYDILYQPKGEFWLIVTFPTSIRLDFSLVYNKEATAGDFMRAGLAITIVVMIYLLILALFAFIYSRITAASSRW